ncbi:MAG: sigma-70 family RNA polymerase sigma factor [Erythrobacter sp.]|jgi:RNA polymerase sigma factor (sigma-70 family)|nr:sigma-70 family RNA polymerase sigma factor [Erythrobacter sp.]
MNQSLEEGPLVAIVDDQRDVRTTLGRGLTGKGYRCHPFSSGNDLLDAFSYLEPDCILLDLRMPGIDGLQTLRSIPESKRYIPVIFFTSHGDIPIAIDAMKSGAADFIEKPASFDEIADKISRALDERKPLAETSHSAREARQVLDQLTKREREVMRLACDGLQSSEIAEQLGLSVRTIESHRYNAIQKLGDSKLINILKIFQAAET